jgi:hypothetical protein
MQRRTAAHDELFHRQTLLPGCSLVIRVKFRQAFQLGDCHTILCAISTDDTASAGIFFFVPTAFGIRIRTKK